MPTKSPSWRTNGGFSLEASKRFLIDKLSVQTSLMQYAGLMRSEMPNARRLKIAEMQFPSDLPGKTMKTRSKLARFRSFLVRYVAMALGYSEPATGGI